MSKTDIQSINRWHLGLILKDARVRAGIAQAAAATALGYSSAFMSQMERGHVAVPLPAVSEIVRLYSCGDKGADARLTLCIIRLTSNEQWESLSDVLGVLLNKDQEAIGATVVRTVTLRLKECGIDL